MLLPVLTHRGLLGLVVRSERRGAIRALLRRVGHGLAVMSLVVPLLPLGAAPAWAATTLTNAAINVQSSAAGIHIDDGLVLFGVDEGDEAGTDLNGDGDTFDVVWHILDTQTNTVQNLGVAAPQTSNPNNGAFEGGTAAFEVFESAQGGTDLNGDGDVLDSVLHVWRGGSVTNLSIAVGIASTVLSSGALMTQVRESAQGADLDGDGFLVSTVPFTWRPGETAPTNLGFLRMAELTADDGLFLFDVQETDDDWNGDGDTFDRIAHVWDSTTDTTSNSGLAVVSFAIGDVDDGRALVKVSELGQGNTDLNGDADTQDTVTHVWDVGTGTTVNLGVASLAGQGQMVEGVGGGGFVFTINEFMEGTDGNGDGDTSDEVLALVSAGSTTVNSFGLAFNDGTGPKIEVVDGTALVTISESDQGNTDLNGDGDSGDNVAHLWTGGTTLANLGLAPSNSVAHEPGMWLNGGLYAVAVSEFFEGNSDLNGDGDTQDRVMHAGVVGSGLTNLGLETSLDSSNEDLGFNGAAGIGDGFLAFIVNELRQGAGDINGDGSIGSNVLHVWDPVLGIEMVPLPVGQRLAVDEGLIALGVAETFTSGGTDLNGDGDTNDLVLHYTAPNQLPSADAGGPYVVDEGSSVVLDGTGSSDPDGTVDGYSWSPGDDLDDSSLAEPTFAGVDDDVVTLTLTVTDDDGATDTATATVTVNNVAPTVEAGADQAVAEGDAVSLDPATFTDPGTADTHTATIDWGDGSAVEAGTVGVGTVDGSHTYAAAGVYTVTVTVTDDDGGIGSDTLAVTVNDLPNQSPTADAGGPYVVDEGSSVVLDGTGSSDPDGTIASYLWSPDISLDDATLAQPTFTGVDDDVVTMSLTVSDDDGATDTATATVTVNNVVPTVEAGADQTANEGDTVSLDPATFTDPGTADTHTATIDWGDGTPVEAGTVGAGTVDGSHTYAAAGVYTVTVTVTDDDGGIGSDTLTVTVNDLPNQSPTADAGGPYVVDEGSSVVLDGTGSSDPDGTIASYLWSPDISLDDSTLAQPTFTSVDDDVVTMSLTVSDDDGATDTATATVTVNNVVPTVEAGADQTANEGDTVSLDPATFTDPGTADTHTATIDWGDGTPVEAGTVGAGTVDGSHNYAAAGVYTVTVTVTDDDGGIGSDTLTVTVNDLPNQSPTADAGGPYVVDEGSSVVLDGTGSSDADGTVTSYLWSPDTNLDDSTLAQPTFTSVDDDVVTMTLEVTDDDGATDTATTTVTVNNVAPTVDAGADQTANEGDTVSLDPATFTDPGTADTHTATIDWGDGTPVEAGTVGAGTVDGSHTYTAAGTYTVTVTVTDDDGGVDSDTFTVTVEAASNTPPVAIDDQTVTRQDTAVSIDVLANDTDSDGDSLSLTILTDPANGTAVVDTDGTVLYTPDTGFVGTDTFTYTANDGPDDSDPATVTVFVIPPNKLLASDGSTFVNFGYSVAVSGDRVVVGAPWDDGSDIAVLGEPWQPFGAVYVFELVEAGGWTETKLVASDAAVSDQFGFSVAVDGDRIVVGAPGDDDYGSASGSVYIYEPDGAGGWAETKLASRWADGGAVLGTAVAVDGDRIVAGSAREVPRLGLGLRVRLRWPGRLDGDGAGS